jgi:PII-like signaling protein
MISQNAILLRMMMSSTDKVKTTALHEAIVYAAKRFGLSGATVLKGMMGFGLSGKMFSPSLWEFSEKVPLILEIVDEEVKIDAFLESIRPYLSKIPAGLLITKQNVQRIQP